MKKTLLYVGLILLAGMLAGALVCGVVWMQTLYELSMSYYIFTVVFWLEMIAVVLFGVSLRKYFPAISKVWVFSSVLIALLCCYTFPQFFTPKCSEIPTVKAGCTTTCVNVCTRWVPLGGTLSDGSTCDKTNSWDIGCCDRYSPSCTTECTYYPPTVSGYTTCSIFGNDGWCLDNGQLHMSGTDPENLTITISGSMVGQAFSCAPGYSCVKTLIEGNGNAIFHSYNGHLSSGNFSVGYKFDATAPTLSPVVNGTVGSNGWYTTAVSVSTGATDAISGIATAKIRLLSGDWQDSLTLADQGTTTVEMSALDNAGNESTQQVQYLVDTVPPVQEIGITAGTPGGTDGISGRIYYLTDVTVTATSGDATSGLASVAYRVDGSAWQDGPAVTVSADGGHVVDFITTDNAGLTDNDSISFFIDQTVPEIDFYLYGTDGVTPWFTSPVTVDIIAEDPTSGVADLEFSLDGSDWAVWSSPLTLTDGMHYIFAYAEDVAWNSVQTDPALEIYIDTLPPVPTVQATGTIGIHDWYRSDVNWQASATDATSGMASIEVNSDSAGWILANTATFSAEGPHTVDFRYTDEAGNQSATHNAFSIDKTNPSVSITTPLEGALVEKVLTITGVAADPLSGLKDVEVSVNGGAAWHSVPWAADGSWSYAWDTTDGPNGVFALIARSTDEAGNSTTQQTNIIVDNAPPSLSITESWWIWETANAAVYENIIPLGSISITVECGDLPDRTYDYNPNRGSFTYKWDRRCGDGQAAASGSYTVVLRACDIYANCASARGKVEIPFVALPISTSTPMPTLLPTQQSLWYQTPTLVPTATTTPIAQALVLPVLPNTGGDEGSGEAQGNPQPLLPLVAGALSASVLLAAASRREEKEALAAEIRAAQQQASALQQAADQAGREESVAAQTVATVNVEAPPVAVSTLAMLAGVVKESFDGIWNEAVRISPADLPVTIVTHNWVNGVDPVKRLQEIAENDAFIEWYYQNVYVKEQEDQKLKDSLEAAEESSSNWNRQYLQIQAEKDPEYMAMINQMADNYTYQWQQIQKENETGSAIKAEYDYSAQSLDFQAGEKSSNGSYEEYNQNQDITLENNIATILNGTSGVLGYLNSTIGKPIEKILGSEITQTIYDFSLGAGKEILLGLFYPAFLAAPEANKIVDVSTGESNAQLMGRVFGNILMDIVGIAEIAGGALGGGGGGLVTVLATGGVGTPVAAVEVGIGVVVIAHGSGTIVVSSARLGENIRAFSEAGSGESSSSSDIEGDKSAIEECTLDDLPDNAFEMYKKYDQHGWQGNVSGQTPGTAAGRKYDNLNNFLPSVDSAGNPITYQEFDVNNKLPNATRDSERFVRGSDGSVYYTDTHYQSTFLQILGGE
jgi:hypothetical protein